MTHRRMNVKKLVIAILALGLGLGGLYAASTDLFSTGASDQFRVTSDGGITNTGTNAMSGATTLSGAVNLSGGVTVSSQATFSVAPVIPTVNIAVSSPTAAGQIVKTSDYVVYISTGIGNISYWTKVGGQ
jgi:hypothetical protein